MLLLLALLACGSAPGSEADTNSIDDAAETENPSGGDTWEWLSMPGDRRWVFQSDDGDLPFTLSARGQTVDSNANDWPVVEITFTYDCRGASAPCDADADADGEKDIEGTTAMIWRLTSDRIDGALFMSFGGVPFDPPVRLSTPGMEVGQVVRTDSGGVEYLSQMDSIGRCELPGYWQGDVDDCATWVLDGPGSDIRGIYSATKDHGFVAFRLASELSGRWSLEDYEAP